ncbi:hypothetical protein CPB83DRAFT_776376 [Crepidotus variabilis]|uniref:Chitin-binding type-4 domain-containing protein n=1 Tax=Crepidotus variabilis TaxID=179855 RepID=A0A9P6E5F5_9AGAR|nr:hypothetical protein CPB83DRAFT_776376 [Crepidotus variabilis]
MLRDLLVLTALVGSALGHGKVTIPTPRAPGTAAQAACGAGAYKVLTSDLWGPIENAAAKVDSGYNATACHLYFCKGYQFDDNKSNVYTYTPGQTVTFHVSIEARHTGYANVSVVDLAARTTIGKPLYNWPVYTNNSLGPPDWPADETDFSITLPDVGTKCQKAGACAIQWYWYAYSNKQTYESCVDFVTP